MKMKSAIFVSLSAGFFLFAAIGCDDESDGGSDGGSDDWAYSLFECPTSPSSIDDFALYRDPASVAELRTTIYTEVSSRIETGQLAPCADPGGADECVEGSYTTADGAQVEYRLATTTTTNTATATTVAIEEETTYITLPEGAATWSALDWSETHTDSYTIGDCGMNRRLFQTAWTGTLAPDWPDDYSLEGTVTHFSGDDIYSNSDYAALIHDRCDFTVSLNWAPGITIRIYDHELQGETGYNCYIDNECVGIIDVDTWEIIGECV